MESIEFYNTPEGDVMYKPIGKPVQVLTPESRDIIDEMLDVIKTRYPQAFKALCELYTASELNRKIYEFNIVSRFCRCNFGEYDAHTPDIDAYGFFHFEEVKCPLRGECQLEGVVCKPEIDTSLTDREMEVYRLIVANIRTEDIAAKLSLSKFTIIRHRENIKARLGLHDIPEMITYWHVHHLK